MRAYKFPDECVDYIEEQTFKLSWELFPDSAYGDLNHEGCKEKNPYFSCGLMDTDEKYAAQHKDGQVSEVEIDLSQANVYPKVFWWQEFQEIWQPQEMFKGYDIVKVIEPNGEEPSIVVLNPKLVRNKNETPT